MISSRFSLRLAGLLSVVLGLGIPASGLSGQSNKLPENCGQLLVSIANGWDSSRASMWCYYKTAEGWQTTRAEPIPVLFGKSGMAWGKGVLPVKPEGRLKREGDRRTPAGLFEIGMVFGYDSAIPGGSSYPYNQVDRWDAWIDDPTNKYYNQHFEASPSNKPSWFESQRMRLGDYAYRYKIEVRHNSDPPVPGYGSAIFFHVRRGPDRTTHGCTTMTESNLLRVIRWLQEDQNPHYVALPKAEYLKVQSRWNLPKLR
ncbi:MAG: L,D-transpeptidase family protein [Verrucomicrobiota bacterium]